MFVQRNSRLQKNEWIVDPNIPEPANMPQPLGWTLHVRPYPVKTRTLGGVEVPDETIDFVNYLTNIGRVIAIAPCCWNRPEYKTYEGKQFKWLEVGDFVSYPANVGAKRMFQGVSYLILNDDEPTEFLPDPIAMKDGLGVNIPKEHLEKYNTIYNPNFKPKEFK